MSGSTIPQNDFQLQTFVCCLTRINTRILAVLITEVNMARLLRKWVKENPVIYTAMLSGYHYVNFLKRRLNSTRFVYDCITTMKWSRYI
uniref:Uncharacterized protein n=1 Tax=Pyxicephalus adspersus TaxID=30357 RepID=A0AAV3A120_PYXAD|nr:TPA: hypothetical protein GDO54_015807 [Pyxicephalus adspersus]